MDTISGNIANLQTTLNENGEIKPFRRRVAVLEAVPAPGNPGGAPEVQGRVELDYATPMRVQHMPGHPHADADGNVHHPNIDVVTEFVNAIEASRAYDANIAAMDVTKQMFQGTFKILG